MAPDMQERDLEHGLIEHLRSLILELGKGFAFVGSQYPLEAGGRTGLLPRPAFLPSATAVLRRN